LRKQGEENSTPRQEAAAEEAAEEARAAAEVEIEAPVATAKPIASNAPAPAKDVHYNEADLKLCLIDDPTCEACQ
jgi:hypothetical protein